MTHAEQRTAQLKAWKDSLPVFLDPDKVDPTMLVPVFRRQSTVLTLAYAHALLLANRQFLLSNFIDLTRPASYTDHRVEFHVQECVEAALVAVNTVSNFAENGSLYRTFWFAQYISFCAMATLYVYAIRRYQTLSTPRARGEDDSTALLSKRGYMYYFEAAEKCRTLIASKTENDSPSRRYSIILDELKRQALVEMQGTSSNFQSHAGHRSLVLQDTNLPVEDRSVVHQQQFDLTQKATGSFATESNLQPGFFDPLLSGRGSLGTTTEPTSAIHLPLLSDTLLDSEQLELSFDSVGWLELDSWVSDKSGSSQTMLLYA